MAQTLRDVWRVHHAREAGRLRWRSAAELPPVAERIQSPYDPEARFSMKRQLRWTGYKVHVTEACDDDMARVITDVATCPSMRPDMTSTAGIHQRLAAKGLLPAEHFVDSGYVDAGLLAGSRRDHGLSLEGPVRGVSSRQTRAGQGYSLPHFRIDWDREQVTCPQGRTSVYWRTLRLPDGSPRIQVQFSRSDCGACAARAACASPGTARRVMQFHQREEYEALRAARARAEDPAWLERYHRRAGVEGTLSQGVRAFGMRQSRYIGLAKTGLQEACTAVAINVSRVVRWLDGIPRAKTRVTRFAALAQAA
jgi:transposase